MLFFFNVSKLGWYIPIYQYFKIFFLHLKSFCNHTSGGILLPKPASFRAVCLGIQTFRKPVLDGYSPLFSFKTCFAESLKAFLFLSDKVNKQKGKIFADRTNFFRDILHLNYIEAVPVFPEKQKGRTTSTAFFVI